MWKCDSSNRSALCIHAYYPDILADILDRIHNSDDKEERIFDYIYITTTPEKSKECQAIATSILGDHGGISVHSFENRGRDIRPFLGILETCIREEIGIICKVHTKKSLHRIDGDAWRNEIYDNLLSKASMRKAKRYLNGPCNPNGLGLLAPKDHILNMGVYWGSNEYKVLGIASDLGISPQEAIKGLFPGGSMYWARTGALLPLLGVINIDEFEKETGQTDGTLAHATERAFGLSATKAGYEMGEIDSDGVIRFAAEIARRKELFEYNG